MSEKQINDNKTSTIRYIISFWTTWTLQILSHPSFSQFHLTFNDMHLNRIHLWTPRIATALYWITPYCSHKAIIIGLSHYQFRVICQKPLFFRFSLLALFHIAPCSHHRIKSKLRWNNATINISEIASPFNSAKHRKSLTTSTREMKKMVKGGCSDKQRSLSVYIGHFDQGYSPVVFHFFDIVIFCRFPKPSPKYLVPHTLS